MIACIEGSESDKSSQARYSALQFPTRLRRAGCFLMHISTPVQLANSGVETKTATERESPALKHIRCALDARYIFNTKPRWNRYARSG